MIKLHCTAQGPFNISSFDAWENEVVAQGGKLYHEESFPSGTFSQKTSFYNFEGKNMCYIFLRKGMDEPCHSQTPTWMFYMKS